MKILTARTIVNLPAAAILTIVAAGELNAQQVADPNFKPSVEHPSFTSTNAPVVRVDEGHYNFYTADGRYKPFAELLRLDGCVVQSSKSVSSKASLAGAKILVIAGALNERNKDNQAPPNPSAFTEAEAVAVRDWVTNGGSLLLIAGPPPFSAAAEKLASTLGLHFTNGFVQSAAAEDGLMDFQRFNGSLVDHPITVGRTGTERVDKVAAFGGSALQIEKDGEPLLLLPAETVCYTPAVFGSAITRDTPHTPLTGWYQGGVRRFGKGRVAAFAEAGLFSAQLYGPDKDPFGMNTPGARENPQFILNVIHWLAGSFDE
jgi:hypothetical protein